MDGREFKDEYEIEHTFAFTSLLGKYAAITIENTGTSEASISGDAEALRRNDRISIFIRASVEVEIVPLAWDKPYQHGG